MVGTPVAVVLPQPIAATELRLTKADGTELLFGFTADETTLLIPIEAEPGQKADYFVYFGNEKAKDVPDMLEDSSEPLDAKVEISAVEEIPYTIIPAEPKWNLKGGWDYLCRSTFRIINTTDQPMNDVPVLLTLRGTQAHGLLGSLTDIALADGSPVVVLDVDDFRLSCKMSLPAKTVKYFNVYYRFDETATESVADSVTAKDSDTAHPELQKAVDPLAAWPNLVKNGDFEAWVSVPDDWNHDTKPPEGVKYSLETSPELVRFGKQCARLDVDKNVSSRWRGWA